MTHASPFAYLFLSAKTKPMQPNTVDIGQQYFNVLLKKLISIDMAGIIVKDDIHKIKKILVDHLEQMVNCSVNEEQINYVVGDIFISNNHEAMKDISEWMLGILMKVYGQWQISDRNHRDTVEYSAFQYTTEQNPQIQNTKNQQLIHISSPCHQQEHHKPTQSSDLKNIFDNLDISEIPKSQQFFFQDIYPPSIQNYLNTILVYRTQINLLSQHMKLHRPFYQREKYCKQYYVKYTKYYHFQFIGDGNSFNYKQGCQYAAKQLLINICIKLPQIINDFVRIKQIKSLF